METTHSYRISLLVVLLFLTIFIPTDSWASQVIGPEHKLYMHLFADYTSESRPVKNASHTVVINFDLSLNQLLDLDEKNQILTTSVWIYEEWTDEMLKWSPTDYEDQRAIMIPATNIWLPDIFIFNTANANMDGFVNVNGSKVAIQHTGNVKWMVPLMISSVCAVDVTYFPYDRQTCTIKFGSWIYDMEQVVIVTESTKPDLEHYVMNSEYDLRHVSISRGVLEGSCCPGDGRHSIIELKIELGRKSLYYDYIVIAPTIMLCVLTLASFLLPCDRGEKMAIGLTVFLTLYVLQLRIADNVPDTNSTPILGVFLLIVMTFNCVSLIMATLVMNIKKRGDDNPCPDVPSWLFSLCRNIFGRVVCTRYLWNDQIDCTWMFNRGENKHTDIHNKKFYVPDKFATRSKNVKCKQISTAKHSARHEECQASFSGENQDEDQINSGPSITIQSPEHHDAVTDLKHAEYTDKSLPSVNPNRAIPSGSHSYDFHKAQCLHNQEDTEMRLRKSKIVPLQTSEPDQQELSGSTQNEQDSKGGVDISKSYLMKRRWFYVAEVVDKFLFIVYLVLLTFSIFTVLFLIPVYFRNDK